MSEEQERGLIDIIHWGQAFVNGQGSLKDWIAKAVANMESYYIAEATKGISRAIKDGMTAAIFYDSLREIRRLHYLKEITTEEYDNNPIKKAYSEYAGAIKFRVGDLDIASVLLLLQPVTMYPIIRPG